VAKASPAVTTNASASIVLGAGSLSDSATLSGGSSPTGTITFNLYGPDNATCSGTPVFTSTKTVSGNGTYTSDSFTPTAAGTYRWIANYSGDANNNATANNCNEANENVTVISPSINIEKMPDNQQIVSGGTATFTITVTNTGDVTLTNVTVTDELAPGCARTSEQLGANATLAAGATFNYTCTRANVTADFTNSATATGTPPVGPNVTDTDTAAVDVTAPAINVEKTPDNQQIVSGGTATFTITVTNTGDVTLTNVTVTDELAPGCARTSSDIAGLASMAPNASVSYQCTRASVTADFTNSATATGTPPVGPNVTDTDTADVDVTNPSINVEKTPDSQTIVNGGTATFTITVTNTGDVTLTNVTVTDELAPGCARTSEQLGANATLAAGATFNYTCTRANLTADFTNSATATGTPPVGPNATDTDTADVDVIAPAINVEKTPDNQQIVSGGTATFTITVTNTGDVALTTVNVTDELAPDCARSNLGTLAPGASTSYTCTRANVTADFTNSATATGTPPSGPDVSDTDTAAVDVTHPSINVEKTPDSQTFQTGGTATFTITVANTGDVTLTNVNVTDALAPGCARTSAQLGANATLAPGATFNYTCTLANVTASFTNSATATGTPPTGPDVNDTDTASVTVTQPPPPPPPPPVVVLTRNLVVTKADSPDPLTLGGDLTYTMTVTNQGPGTMTGVTAADTLPAGVTFGSATSSQGTCVQAAGVVTCSIGTMPAGATVTVTVVVRPTATGTITNTVVVVGNEAETSNADNTASVPTLVVGPLTPPATCLSLTATPRQLVVGKRATIVARVRLTNGRPFVRAQVRVTAPGINRSSRTNAQGIARIAVKPTKAGIARITVAGSARCSARSGIIGVFQPPVTG
jgi:uncharacterized repeat protein (TIGR01451 family)